jgi:hypothetical protein
VIVHTKFVVYVSCLACNVEPEMARHMTVKLKITQFRINAKQSTDHLPLTNSVKYINVFSPVDNLLW